MASTYRPSLIGGEIDRRRVQEEFQRVSNGINQLSAPRTRTRVEIDLQGDVAALSVPEIGSRDTIAIAPIGGDYTIASIVAPADQNAITQTWYLRNEALTQVLTLGHDTAAADFQNRVLCPSAQALRVPPLGVVALRRANRQWVVVGSSGLDLSADYVWTGAHDFAGGVTVSGIGLDVDAGGISVTAGGITVSAGGISVTAGGISVAGASAFTNAVTFNGAADFNASANFDASATFNALADFNAAANFDGQVDFNADVDFNLTSTFTGAANFDGQVDFNADVDFNSTASFASAVQFGALATVQFTAATTFNALADFNAAANFDGQVDFNADVDVNSTSTFTGSMTINGFATFNNSIAFSGANVVSDAGTPVILNDDLTVNGATEVEAITVNAGAIIFGNTTHVSGNAVFSGTVFNVDNGTPAVFEDTAEFQDEVTFSGPVIYSTRTLTSGSNLNNVAVGTDTVIKIDATANIDLTGFSGGTEGRFLIVINDGTGGDIDIRRARDSTVGNQIVFTPRGASDIITLGTRDIAAFLYVDAIGDNGNGFWYVLWHTGVLS